VAPVSVGTPTFPTYAAVVSDQPLIANRQEAWLCLVATVLTVLAVFTSWLILLPFGTGPILWVFFSTALEAIIAWKLLVARLRRRTRTTQSVNLVFNRREWWKSGRWMRRVRIAWRVVKTGEPSAETFAATHAEGVQSDAIERKRREIERELQRHPF